MRILPRKEYEEELKGRGLAIGQTEDKAEEEAKSTQAIMLSPELEILAVKGVSSGVKLHEVGHKVLGRTSKYSDIETGKPTVGADILDEILAEKYAYEAKDKRLTYRLIIPAINMLLWTYKWSPEAAVFWSLSILKKELGISASKSERRELVRHASGYPRRPRRRL